MSTRVKICGLTNATDRNLAIDAGADALGFISGVPVETPRELPISDVTTLATDVPPFVTTVLVTAPETVAEAVSRYEQAQTDALQIHGSLSPDEIATVREQVDATVIVAVAVDAPDETLDAYAASADALLVDSAAMGGTGETHDWERTRALRAALDTPLILAGGLTPENVSEGVTQVSPFAVDVASGVEREGGTKDPEAVRAFVSRAGVAG